VVEHLLCKCKALSSNPNPTGKKKRTKSKVFNDHCDCHILGFVAQIIL
jgi:hypothetical protein